MRRADKRGEVIDIIDVLHRAAQDPTVKDGAMDEFDVESGKVATVAVQRSSNTRTAACR